MHCIVGIFNVIHVIIFWKIVCNHYHSHFGTICVLNAIVLCVFADLGVYCPASKLLMVLRLPRYGALWLSAGNVLLSCILPILGRLWISVRGRLCLNLRS